MFNTLQWPVWSGNCRWSHTARYRYDVSDVGATTVCRKIKMVQCEACLSQYRARKSRTTLQNKVRLKVLPEQLTLFVNTSVTFKKCIIQ